MKRLYYFAEIDTRYEVCALSSRSRSHAVNLAAKKAKEFLNARDQVSPITGKPWTVQGVIDYFAPTVTTLEMDSAEFVGGGDGV
jgi:hypothetical protein